MGDEERPRYASAEIFDPHTGQWTPTGPMTVPRSEVEYASVLLPDGRVLVPGGQHMPHMAVSSSDLYDPRTGTWTASGSMSIERAGHSSIVLRGNRGVLVMGGEGDKVYKGRYNQCRYCRSDSLIESTYFTISRHGRSWSLRSPKQGRLSDAG